MKIELEAKDRAGRPVKFTVEIDDEDWARMPPEVQRVLTSGEGAQAMKEIIDETVRRIIEEN